MFQLQVGCKKGIQIAKRGKGGKLGSTFRYYYLCTAILYTTVREERGLGFTKIERLICVLFEIGHFKLSMRKFQIYGTFYTPARFPSILFFLIFLLSFGFPFEFL